MSSLPYSSPHVNTNLKVAPKVAALLSALRDYARRYPGKPMPHAEIARRVWGPNILSTSYIANLQELVKKARAALPPTDMIVTERGRGYWLALDVDPAITKQRIVPHDKLSQFCPNYHEYTPDNTKIEPDGTRSCRKCRKATTRKYRETSILRGAT